jgi:hypothetical protein
MTTINCARGACQRPINPGDVMFWIANEPMYAPPADCRAYCRQCGFKITEFAVRQHDKLEFAVGRHPFVPEKMVRKCASNETTAGLLDEIRTISAENSSTST